MNRRFLVVSSWALEREEIRKKKCSLDHARTSRIPAGIRPSHSSRHGSDGKHNISSDSAIRANVMMEPPLVSLLMTGSPGVILIFLILPPSSPAQISSSSGFIENRGEWPAEARYLLSSIRLRFKGSQGEVTLDVQHLPSGLYSFELRDRNERSARLVMIVHYRLYRSNRS